MDERHAEYDEMPWADKRGASLDQEPLDDDDSLGINTPFGGELPSRGASGKKKPAFKGGFFQMPFTAYHSEQHVSLGMASKIVLMFVLSKYRGDNNGMIDASAREAASMCGINKETASIAFRQLEEAGFLDCVTEHKLIGREWRSPQWRLTFLRCDVTGAPASNKFLRTKPAPKRKPKAN